MDMDSQCADQPNLPKTFFLAPIAINHSKPSTFLFKVCLLLVIQWIQTHHEKVFARASHRFIS